MVRLQFTFEFHYNCRTIAQSAIKASTTKGKKDKKKAKKVQDFDEPLDEEPAAVVEKASVEMTAEDLADEEWGPSKDKGKKGKKGNEKKGKAQNKDEELAQGNISVLSL